MRTKGLTDNTKVVLFGNYLSAFIYSSEACMKYLEQEGILEEVFQHLFILDKNMFHPYQRKLYLIALGQCLFSSYIPQFVTENIVKIISKMILMLGRLNLTEKYREKKLQEDDGKDGKLNIHNIDFMDNPVDNDDDKIEDELKDLNDYYDAKESQDSFGQSSTAPFTIVNSQHRDEHEEKQMEDSKDDNLNDSFRDDDSDIYEDEDDIEDERMEIEMSCEMLHSKVKDMDENDYFKSIMTKLYHNNPEDMAGLIQQLSEKQSDFMKKLLQTHKVTVELNGETKTVHRRIVKARRRQ